MEAKLVLVWVIGSIFMLAGTWIVSNLELTTGVTTISYFIALLASLVLYLLAGICWISVAVATKSH